MLYNSFDEVDLPFMTVTEPNPSAVIDFYRFSSDQLLSYNALQVSTLRNRCEAVGRADTSYFITTNFMGFFWDFDHFGLATGVPPSTNSNLNLDHASWDSYPLGFTDAITDVFDPKERLRYAKTGKP